MGTTDDKRYSRRRFLGRVGAGAAGTLTVGAGWRPTLPAAFSGAGEFRINDFLAFAGVDPASLA